MSLTAWATASEIRDVLARGEASCTEVTRLFLERIAAQNPRLNAVITVTEGRALAKAAELDVRRGRGETLRPWPASPW